MAWFRLESSFANHPKAVKLARRLDVPLPYARGLVVGLWCYVIDNAPDGNLADCDADDLAIAAGWSGDADQFVDALKAVKFVVDEQGDPSINGWNERQSSYKESVRKAEYRAKTRQRRDNSNMSQDSPRTVLESPKNVPLTDRQTDKTGPTDRQTNKQDKSKNRVSVLSIIEHYKKHHPETFPMPSPSNEEWRMISRLLEKDGFSVEQIKTAIDEHQLSPWHNGARSGGEQNLQLRLAVKDAGTVSKWLTKARTRASPSTGNPEIDALINLSEKQEQASNGHNGKRLRDSSCKNSSSLSRQQVERDDDDQRLVSGAQTLQSGDSEEIVF